MEEHLSDLGGLGVGGFCESLRNVMVLQNCSLPCLCIISFARNMSAFVLQLSLALLLRMCASEHLASSIQ